jgi:hypothetical protein
MRELPKRNLMGSDGEGQASHSLIAWGFTPETTPLLVLGEHSIEG